MRKLLIIRVCLFVGICLVISWCLNIYNLEKDKHTPVANSSKPKLSEGEHLPLERKQHLLKYEKDVRAPNQTPAKHVTDSNSHKAENWTLLVSVNNGFFDFFLNWFWYYKNLNIRLPIIIVAEDDEVYKKLKSSCDYCVVLRSDLNITGAQSYKDSLYNKLVSARPGHILNVLRSGKNVIYADIDSVWLQNPLPFLNTNADIVIQLDGPKEFCTGFMAIQSNTNTIDVVQQWHERLMKAPTTNQGAFNKVLYLNKRRYRNKQSKKIVSCVALNSLYFPSGKEYFVKYDDEKRAHAVIVHNNWIVGHDVKIKRFKKFNLWQI